MASVLLRPSCGLGFITIEDTRMPPHALLCSSAQALHAAAELVSGTQRHQDTLASSTVLPSAKGTRMPALHATLRVAIKSASATEALAAGRLLSAYCLRKLDGQSALASTMTLGDGKRALDGHAGLDQQITLGLVLNHKLN